MQSPADIGRGAEQSVGPGNIEIEMAVFGATIEWYRTGSVDAEQYLNQVDIAFPVTARASDPRVLE